MQNESNEEFKVKGEDIIKKIKEIIAEGNARKIIIKNEKGDSVMEFPLTVGVVGTVLLPVLAAAGALAALLANCTIVVIKKNDIR